MTPKKPQNIPQEATWNKKENEWEIGEKNAEGKSIGKWLWWRKDGSLVCEAYYDGDTGQNFTFTRFHEDGTFSQQGTFLNGQYHDVLTCQISEKPTTEGVNAQQKQMHPNVFSWKMFFDQGKQIRSGAFFNKNGEEISVKGTLKPKNIPLEAVIVNDGTWQLQKDMKGILEKFNGITKGWDEQGNLIWEAIYDIETENVKKAIYYHTDGSIYRENDFETCIGYSQKSEKPTFQNLEEFKGDTYKITYNFLTANAKTGLISTTKKEYYDKNGNKLTSEGKAIIIPSARAKMIEETGYSGTSIYFYEAQFNNFNQKEGLLTYWYSNGQKRYEAEYNQNLLCSLKVYNQETGLLKTEETFYCPKSEVFSRGSKLDVIVQSLKIYENNKVQEFLMNEKGFCTTVNRYESGNLTSSLKNSHIKDNLNLSEFVEEFNKRYANTGENACIEVDNYFDIIDNQMYEDTLFDEFFKVAVLTGDGAGNELILIQEPGEHYGKIYDNDHEEGLYSLESIDDYLEEFVEYNQIHEVEGIDEEAEIDLDYLKSLDKNILIKLMPFYQNDTKIADSLNELMNMVNIMSYDTYRTELADLEKIILNK